MRADPKRAAGHEVVLGGGHGVHQPVDGQTVRRHAYGDHAVGEGAQAELGGVGELLHRRPMLPRGGGQCADSGAPSPGYAMPAPELSRL